MYTSNGVSIHYTGDKINELIEYLYRSYTRIILIIHFRSSIHVRIKGLVLCRCRIL